MLNFKLSKNLATTVLAVCIISLSFGCEKAQEQSNPDTTINNPNKKVDFKVNVASGSQEGKTLNGWYTYTSDTFELTEINIKGFDNKDISKYCNKLKVDTEKGLGLHGTCNTPTTTYIFGNDSSGRGHVIYPFDYSVKAEKTGDGGGIVEYKEDIKSLKS